MTSEPRLPFDEDVDGSSALPPAPPGVTSADALPDAASRRAAVDPSQNVVLEASAGTGKTRVLVERYVNLLRAGVEPEHILAMTFTRKAAAEMRQRIVERLKEASRTSTLDAARWRDLRDRLGDIAIATIDAFCLGLLREFPLEADVDPGFALADDTEVPRLVEEALDRSLRICRGLAQGDDDVALVFAQLGERRLRNGLAGMLARRLVAPAVLRRYLAAGPRDLTAATACGSAAARLAALFSTVAGGLPQFLDSGPLQHPQFAMLAHDIAELCGPAAGGHRFGSRGAQAAFRQLVDRLRGYFLTQEGKPRGERFTGTGFTALDCDSATSWKRHRAAAAGVAPAVVEAVRGFRRDLNVVLSRGVWRMFAVTVSQYQRTLDARALLDFSGVLEHAVHLLSQMDEFARSRYRLEARYHHVLVDEFQDTSRAQWALVEQLVQSWGEGLGASADALPPSIFIVGDRKQSIYGFRDAEVALLDEAAQFVGGLREQHDARHAISVSFRSVPALLGFVNDVFDAVAAEPREDDGPRYAFKYGERDRFPLPTIDDNDPARAAEAAIEDLPLGLIAGSTNRLAAEAVAGEIVGLIGHATVRDRSTGIRRTAAPADVAILFRSRESHREFESALERRNVPTYVYKGLGFFDADEIQDGVAVLRYLAEPTSNLRAAAYLRSRLIRLSDAAVTALAPNLAAAVIGDQGTAVEMLGIEDQRVLTQARASTAQWLALVDRVTPAELLDQVLRDSAYYWEIRGPRRRQARENLKKLRGLIRRIQNRGYATLARIADHLEQLAIGDESNAAIDAVDAVSLMTVHAAKGLEFPIVFVVNIGRGTGAVRAPIRIATSSTGVPAVAVADFQSEADEETQSREREETKRLVYVALTRARDRLYLSALVQNGVCRMGRGSLGEVLPGSLVELFVQAGASAQKPVTVTWSPAAGGTHRMRAVSGAAEVPEEVAEAR